MSKKILIVDDEQDILVILGKRLRIEGYHVITAANAKDALLAAKTHHLDLIILDVMLPDMLGGDLAGELKNNPKTQDIPIIYLTALLSKNEESTRDHMIGNNITFSKPYDEIQLLEQIKKTLDCSLIG